MMADRWKDRTSKQSLEYFFDAVSEFETEHANCSNAFWLHLDAEKLEQAENILYDMVTAIRIERESTD